MGETLSKLHRIFGLIPLGFIEFLYSCNEIGTK